MQKVAEKLHSEKKYKYFCKYCLYGCNNKTNFNKHKNTTKHINATCATSGATVKSCKKFICKYCNKKYLHSSSYNRHKKICKGDINKNITCSNVSKCFQNVSNQYICKCGKKYKTRSGFYKHNSKCLLLQYEGNQNGYADDFVPTNNVEILLKALIEKNDSILEENKELRNEIKNLKMGNTMINSNNNNNSFNINMFLNEKCKNAMNLEDFVKKIKLTLEDLNFTKENGYAKGISNIFIKNLNDMDVTERPIHCSDQKRLQFYVKMITNGVKIKIMKK